MAPLSTLSKEQKKINFVWIGDASISYLGAFNILSWVACGWTVTIYKHPPIAEEASVSSLFHEDARPTIAKVGGDDLSVVSLRSAVEPETDVMPMTRLKLLDWMKAMEVGYTRYAIGDLAKSFIAGTREGIVLDLKVGPSKWIYDFPAEPFLNKFISYSRAGAFSVENQCLGSLQLASSNKYGARFDQAVPSRLANVTFQRQTDAQAAFATITSMHQSAFKHISVKGEDIKLLDSGKWEFGELKGTSNSGPFRVYQKAGFFNWNQGEYPEAKQANDKLVAATLRDEHTGERSPGKPFNGENLLFYRTDIRPMAVKAIQALDKA